MNATLISDTIRKALASAGIRKDTRQGSVDIHRVIDDALSAAGLSPGRSGEAGPATRRAPQGFADAAVPEGRTDPPGEFISRRYAGPRGSRDYRLYIPSAHRDGGPLPLVVMLHGCKQDPNDFAAGTRMNVLAERHGFLVAYPAQTRRANGSNCWNWFDTAQQRREGEEPSILAGIAHEIQASHGADPARTYVAGLSAGAAMAVILGQTHPEVFAAVGAHSGLPKGVAHDVPSAFAAMQARGAPVSRERSARAVRTIVFHGDADATVTALNGAAIAGEAVRAFEHTGVSLEPQPIAAAEHGRRRCTASAFCDALGVPLVEEWVIHGAGHAWSGGDPAGSYTDRSGPDASAEFVRFFLGADAAVPLLEA